MLDYDVAEIARDVNFNTKGPFDVFIGNRELMKKQNIEIPNDAEEITREHETRGETGVFVAINGKIISSH